MTDQYDEAEIHERRFQKLLSQAIQIENASDNAWVKDMRLQLGSLFADLRKKYAENVKDDRSSS